MFLQTCPNIFYLIFLQVSKPKYFTQARLPPLLKQDGKTELWSLPNSMRLSIDEKWAGMDEKKKKAQ
jgi:hypothetical protein